MQAVGVVGRDVGGFQEERQHALPQPGEFPGRGRSVDAVDQLGRVGAEVVRFVGLAQAAGRT